MKTLSNYYLNVPFVSPLTNDVCTSYTVNIYVWSGLKANVPTQVSYSLTKENILNSSGTDKINVSRLVNDFLSFTPLKSNITELINTNSVKWVKTEVIYTTGNPLDVDVKQLENVQIAYKGYTYGIEGENADVRSNNVLIPLANYNVNRDGFFTVPIKLNEV